MIRYTCIHCGKVANLPDEKRETIFTCPACQFSNWVSGLAIGQVDLLSPELRQNVPPTRAPAGQSQAPHPALQHFAPQHPALQHPTPQHPAARRPLGSLGQQRTSQPHSAPKGPPPPPLPPAQAAKPGAAPPRPMTGLERNLEMLQRDSARATQPPQYRPRPVHSENRPSQTCPEATWAFVLGVVNLFASLIFGPLGIFLGIVTLGLAVKAKTKIAADPARYQGAGLASVAVFLGVLSLVFAMVRSCAR